MNQNTKNRELFFSVFPYLIFLTGSFIYFGFFVDYIFFFQEKSSLFISSSDFLIENLHQPGGLLIYLGKFFSTFFYYPLVGAAIVSVILTLTILTISKIISFLSGKVFIILPFVIGSVLFYLQSNYQFLIFNNLGLLLQLALFLLSIKYLKFLKGWIPVLIVPFWFFATGGFALIFSLLLTFNLASEKSREGWIKVILLWCLNLITFYISKEFLFFQPGKVLLMYPFSEQNTGSQQVLFLIIAGIASILPVMAKIKFNLFTKFKVTTLVGGLITSTLIIIALVTIGINQFDKKNKQYFHVEKLFYENKFDEVINYNLANPSNNMLTIFLNNIALCETNKLNDLLFNFRQSPDGSTLFLKWEMVSEVLKRGGYFYYTIGMVNEAHRWAYENMVMKGLSPEGLKMLIRTELINGNYRMAAKYIALLKNTFFYKNEANTFEKCIYNDSAITANHELGEKRQGKISSDFFSITDDPNINIERILATDTLSRKAFEYKLAFMLVKKDYKGIAALLPKLQEVGFNKVPALLGEAAVAYSTLNSKPLPNLGTLSIDPQTEPRWTQFLQTFQANGNNLKTAEPALRNNFKNTFWYYSFYL